MHAIGSIAELREKGIGVNIHYIPVHFHPFYRREFHTTEGMCPQADLPGISRNQVPSLSENNVDEAKEQVIGKERIDITIEW